MTALVSARVIADIELSRSEALIGDVGSEEVCHRKRGPHGRTA